VADGSAIEWTDATWNPITGCTIATAGCAHCYAMVLAGTRLKHHPSRAGLTRETKAGPVWTGEVRFNEFWLDQPLRWAKPRNIFVCAHGDLCAPGVPFEWIDRVFGVVGKAGRHNFQVLTKRPDKLLEYVRFVMALPKTNGATAIDGTWLAWPLPNVIFGASVERQPEADARREAMRELALLGWPTWCSYEPALGPVDWTGWEFLRCIVSGGESGQGARPHHPDWHRATRDFCAAHGIAYQFKQWGEWKPGSNFGPLYESTEQRIIYRDGASGPVTEQFARSRDLEDLHNVCAPEIVSRVGKSRAGRLLDGVEHNGLPEARP
jgi:protein gp37